MQRLGRLAALLLLVLWLLPMGAAVAAPPTLFQHPLPDQLPAPLQQIRQRFRQAQVLVVRFKQEKQLPDLQHPLVSHGTLTVVPSLGLEWRITRPFASVWRVARDGTVLEGSENPASQAVARLLIALLSADTKALRSTFSLYWQRPSQQWWLGLKPRNARLKKALHSIVVAGDRRLQRVSVRQSNDDRTTLYFTATETRPLDHALRAKFTH